MDGVLLFGWKACIRDIKFKIYWVSKSIPVAKSQNFVDIPGEQNLQGQNLIFLPEQKSTCGHITSCINLTMKMIKLY